MILFIYDMMKTMQETKKIKTREKDVTGITYLALSSVTNFKYTSLNKWLAPEVFSNISTWQIPMLQLKFHTLQNIHHLQNPHFLAGQCRIHRATVLTAEEIYMLK